ncbi:MAG: hypothetical protein GOU99_01750 [Candidatus Altiarchaeota archaeon]|nr:hypothetical protein [Candidatus Altiarchaeota archaeon]
MVLEKKIKGKLAKTIIAPAEAFELSGVQGTVLSFSASWHRIYDGEEKVDMANFEFLTAVAGKPHQLELSFGNNEWTKNIKDISDELGDVEAEAEFVGSIKLLKDAEILEAIEKTPSIKNHMRRTPHLRVFSMDFLMYDDKYEAPVWKVVLKNWPLTNYFRKETPVTFEVVVEGMRGKVISAKKSE